MSNSPVDGIHCATLEHVLGVDAILVHSPANLAHPTGATRSHRRGRRTHRVQHHDPAVALTLPKQPTMHDPIITLPNGNAVHYADIRGVRALEPVPPSIGFDGCPPRVEVVCLVHALTQIDTIVCETFDAACTTRNDIITRVSTLRAQVSVPVDGL